MRDICETSSGFGDRTPYLGVLPLSSGVLALFLVVHPS